MENFVNHPIFYTAFRTLSEFHKNQIENGKVNRNLVALDRSADNFQKSATKP